ncbi:MAG: hypothetical protein KGJ78_12745 [Alphaproteobacteria bacterium]|nr:hypothetical protein [Alphaproteobacteria bacterium]
MLVPEPPILDILYNFHWIREGEAARSSQAHFGGLGRLMRRHGLKSILNLRGENSDLSWWRYERHVCERLAARHIDTMLDSRKLPTRAMLTTLIDAFDQAPRPFLLKCSGGQDRTSLAAALYLIHRDGWSGREIAERHFAALPYLHFPKKHQRWLRLFPGYAQQASQGSSLADWIRQAYTPEDFADWLRQRGQGDTFDRIFTVPTRSRWQW